VLAPWEAALGADVELATLDGPVLLTVPLDLEHTCGLTAAEIDELVEFGALLPQLEGSGKRKFSVAYVEPLRQAAKLRHHYDLDLFAVGLVLGYLARIERQEERLRALHAHLPHAAPPEREGPAPWRELHG
jgi:chaperone modulatory protein CbpM